MRVLVVTPFFHPATMYGGAARAAHGLSAGLVEAGCEVRVLTTNAAGPRQVLDVASGAFEQTSDGLAVRYCRRWLPDAVSPSLVRALPAGIEWADVLHLHSVYSFPTFPVLSMCRAYDQPLVWSPHGALQRWEGTTKPAAKWLWEQTCRALRGRGVQLHCTSQAEVEASAERLAPIESFILPNGVELPREVEPRPVNPSGDELSLLYLGRMDPQKGLDRLVDACIELDRRGAPAWRLHIAGEGGEAYRRTIAAKIDAHGLRDRVTMVGHVDGPEKERLFAETDVLVAPSHRENFGIVVAEALARSRPVIASRGMPWSVLESEACGLWTDNHPMALADAIEKMAGESRSEMGVRGRAYVERELAWSAIALQMRDRYAALIG